MRGGEGGRLRQVPQAAVGPPGSRRGAEKGKHLLQSTGKKAEVVLLAQEGSGSLAGAVWKPPLSFRNS